MRTVATSIRSSDRIRAFFRPIQASPVWNTGSETPELLNLLRVAGRHLARDP